MYTPEYFDRRFLLFVVSEFLFFVSTFSISEFRSDYRTILMPNDFDWTDLVTWDSIKHFFGFVESISQVYINHHHWVVFGVVT